MSDQNTNLTSMQDPAIDPVRTAVRFPLQLTVELEAGTHTFQGKTEDISASGVLFVMDQAPPLDARVEFTIHMPAAAMGTDADVAVRCVGRIVRHQSIDGVTKAAAVIDEYTLNPEHTNVSND